MSYNQDLENAVRRIFVEAYPTGKGEPLITVHEPTDTISDETWKKIKQGYMVTFTIMKNINDRVVSGYLDWLWENWKRGGYKCSEDFINVVDELMENLRKVQASRNKLTFMDEELYDELLEEFEKVINQRTWDDSITDKMLKDKAIEHQTDIELYLKKRVEHNLILTDKMQSFKGLETIERDLLFETVIKPQLEIADSNRKAMAMYDFENAPPKSKLHPDNIAKTKEKYSVKRKTEEPILDFAHGWKCALAMRQKIVNGDFGTSWEDVAINDAYRWAGQNCTIDGEKFEWKKLIKDYSNAHERVKAGDIIAKFERKYYKKIEKK